MVAGGGAKAAFPDLPDAVLGPDTLPLASNVDANVSQSLLLGWAAGVSTQVKVHWAVRMTADSQYEREIEHE